MVPQFTLKFINAGKSYFTGNVKQANLSAVFLIININKNIS